MEILKTHKDYIASEVNLLQVAHALRFYNHINENDLAIIQNETDDKIRMQTIIDKLESAEDSFAVIRLLTLLRYSYPTLSTNIPDILTGVRITVSLGFFKVLKVALYSEIHFVDIRQYEVFCIFLSLSFFVKPKMFFIFFRDLFYFSV